MERWTCPKGHEVWRRDRYDGCIVCDEAKANDELEAVIDELEHEVGGSQLDRLTLEVRVLRKLVVTPDLLHPPSENIRKLRDYYKLLIEELKLARNR